jgi:choline dehydrogenase
MQSKALARFAPEELMPGPEFQTDRDLERAAADLGTTIFHPVGTCAMGQVSAQGAAAGPNVVLDSGLRLRGVARLRVIDASAMPQITSGNTNAPVMLIAEQAARELIKEQSPS